MDAVSLIARLKEWARKLKRDVIALWLAARDPRVSWGAKLLAAVIAAYALSPLDLIPDFVPVLGYLDDLILIPAGIWLATRFIPSTLMEELRARAALQGQRKSLAGLLIVLVMWIAAVLLIWTAS